MSSVTALIGTCSTTWSSTQTPGDEGAFGSISARTRPEDAILSLAGTERGRRAELVSLQARLGILTLAVLHSRYEPDRP